MGKTTSRHGMLCTMNHRLSSGNSIWLASFFVLIVCCHLGQPSVLPSKRKNSTNAAKRYPLPDVEVCNTWACREASRFFRLSIDLTADPCEDFYQYACGLWKDLNPIPDDQGVTSTFKNLADSISADLKEIMNKLDTGKYKEKSVKLLLDVYKKCVDEDAIEQAGAEPLKRHIKQFFFVEPSTVDTTLVNRLSKLSDNNLEMLAAHLWLNNGVSVLVSPFVEADMKDNTYNILSIDQASLGLGYKSEDYYLGNSETHKRVRQEYLKLMEDVSAYLWNSDSSMPPTEAQRRDAAEILNFEIQLAGLNKPANERRDPTAMYNKMSVVETVKLGTKFDLLEYMSHLNSKEEVNIVEPKYMEGLNELISRTSPDVVKGYFLWRLIYSRLPILAKPLSDKYYNFTKIYRDVGRNSDREKYCVNYVMGEIGDDYENLGYIIGRLFIDMKNFTRDTKQHMNDMIDELYKSFNNLLDINEWMDNETKQKARLKITKMISNVGYPDVVVDDLDSLYTALLTRTPGYYDTQITETDSFYDIYNKLAGWTSQNKNLKVGQPFDRQTFAGSPATVNAWFYPSKNSITFPAGILQPPFYHRGFPSYVNFGAIGSVIGHEITHGFDDEGSHFDGLGNLVNWWTPESRRRFEEKAQCMIDQYSKFCYPNLGDNVCVKGVETQGENIADNGGLIQGFYAYQNYMKDKKDLVLPSFEEFTPEQMFFVSYATFECNNYRDAALANRISTNEHAPGRDRVIGPFQNFLEFSRTFNCPVGSRMNPVHKCSIW